MAKESIGEDPVFDARNLKAYRAFIALHNQVTMDFPGAWNEYFRWTPIPVDDEWEVQYFLRAWADFYSTLKDIATERMQKKQRDQELMQKKPNLRID